MTVDGWFELHDDVGFTINHPKTKAGHKTDFEMWSRNQDVKIFRETITYMELTEEGAIEILDEMYSQIKKIETENVIRNSV